MRPKNISAVTVGSKEERCYQHHRRPQEETRGPDLNFPFTTSFYEAPDLRDFILNVKICHKHIVCLWNFNSTTTKGFCGRNKFQNKNEDYYYASNKQWYKFTGSIFSCICVQLVTLFITNGSSQLLIIRVDWGVADGDELLCRLSRNREGCQCNRCSL